MNELDLAGNLFTREKWIFLHIRTLYVAVSLGYATLPHMFVTFIPKHFFNIQLLLTTITH